MVPNIGINPTTLEGSYMSIKRVISGIYGQSPFYENSLHDVIFQKTHKSIQYKRTVYDPLALIGDLGGVLDIVVSVIGLFMYPYSDFNF